MKETALVIMAAGIGSRFGGGIKQLAKVGPQGEVIIDYSIHDAMEAGFDKIIFIIRKEIEKDFKAIIGNRVEKHAKCFYAYQELDKLPEGYSVPEDRKKPWGTGHALVCAKEFIDCPFAVINADDYYGKEGFKLIHDYLVNDMKDEEKMDFCMAGFIVGNTLSENGAVTRGVCSVEDGRLLSVTETYEIARREDGLFGKDEEGNEVAVSGDAIVSMNMWGFPKQMIDVLSERFPSFLDAHGKEVKSEYLLPQVVDELIRTQKAEVRVLEDHDKWFGVTYAEDKESVVRSFAELTEKGVYPEKLFD